MFSKGIISMAFVTHALVGSFCMMPLAAADAPQPAVQHEEMNMTPMDAMSHADCDHCEEQKQSNDPVSSDCAGHCLAAASESMTSNTVSAQRQVHAVIVNPISTVAFAFVEQPHFIDSSGRSPQKTVTRGIVLRQ